ncbi:MAG: putative beta-lysine N-acetyltransferase [Phycisphaerae bacterium]
MSDSNQQDKDVITTLGNSRIQHGKANDRIYLMKLDPADSDSIIEKLDKLAAENDYSKIFAKIPCEHATPFLDDGYVKEAEAEGFYNGTQDACFLGKFLKDWRKEDPKREKHEEAIQKAKDRAGEGAGDLPEGHTWRKCTHDDVDDMVVVYREVFASYPFPIHDPDYLRKTMDENVVYFGIWHGEKLVALSSSEEDRDAQNSEMTDFATLPDQRGKSLAVFLLARMEEDAPSRGIKTAYTIARSNSFGMNITFGKMDYTFGGRLLNNTQISGGFESMNIWYKPLVR